MEGAVSIYTDKGPVSTVIIGLKLGVCLLGVFLLWRMVARGPGNEEMVLGLAFLIAGAVFAGLDLKQWLDRSPQVTLSEAGLLDHRKGQARLVPWSEVGSIGYRGGFPGGWSLAVYPLGGKGKTVLVDGTYLAIKPKALVKLIQRFAPEVPVHPAHRLWIG